MWDSVLLLIILCALISWTCCWQPLDIPSLQKLPGQGWNLPLCDPVLCVGGGAGSAPQPWRPP